MKKLIVPLSMLLVLVFLLTACGGNGTTTSTTTTPPVGTTTTATTPSNTATPTTTTPAATTPVADTPNKGGTLQVIYPFSPSSTPGWPNDRSNVQKMWMEWTVFEPLIKLSTDNQPQPWLATEWKWGDKNLSITFTLRQGVKFTDGTDFKSDAVTTEGNLVISTKESNTVDWDRWEAIDDYHVTLYLKQYHNDFWGNLAGINMCFPSPTAYKANGVEWMKEHPIGTGPFMFQSFEKDVALKLVKNPNYWGKDAQGNQLPYLDGIDFITTKEELTQQAKMQAGEGDMLVLVQGKILDDMKKLGFTVLSSYGGTDMLIFDTSNPSSPFANPKVRQAVEYAIDKQAMVDALGYGYLVKNNQAPPPNNPAYNPNLPSRDYDPAKAKALLAEAGYANGVQGKLIAITGSGSRSLSEQQYLQAVGINVTIDSVDNLKYWDYCMKGWTNGALDAGYAVGPNFPAWLKTYFPPTGIFDVSTKLPDDIIAKINPALSEIDPVKAKALSDELIKMVYDDATIVPLYSNAMGYILAPKVHDSGVFSYLDWSIWSPEKTWIDKK